MSRGPIVFIEAIAELQGHKRMCDELIARLEGLLAQNGVTDYAAGAKAYRERAALPQADVDQKKSDYLDMIIARVKARIEAKA